MKCPYCGIFVKCIQCVDYICPTCGTDLDNKGADIEKAPEAKRGCYEEMD